MTLIVMKEKNVLDLPSTLRVALKSIYDPKHTTNQEIDLMMSSIVDWKNHLDIRRDIGFNAEDDENQIALEYIGRLLKDNQEGKLEGRKFFFKRHNISYLKFYRMPGAVSVEDVCKAQEHLKQNMKEHPEYYN